MRRKLLLAGNSHSFIISGVSEYTGIYFFLQARYDGRVVPAQWSVVSGGSSVSVNQNGRVDIVSGTVGATSVIRADYLGRTAVQYVTVTYDNQLVIECAETIAGTSGNAVARYNGTIITPTWSVASGGAYASIDSSGAITITASGNATIQAVYNGYTTQKPITVVYNAGSVTETVVDPETGNTTTTTTTTETDPVTGETTTTQTTTTVNDDGSSSETQSETVTQSDGSSETTSTTTNSDGSSSETTSTTTAPDQDGTTQTTATTTNSDGTSSEYSGTNYSDGSSESTTTNYNAEGDPTSTTNEEVDTEGNNSTQEVAYDTNGDPVVTGYTIDTSGNQDGSKEFDANGVNTEFYGFDEVDGFVLNMHFTIDFTDQPANQDQNHHQILSMKRANPSPWYGFQLRQSGTNKYIQLGCQFEFGSNTNTTIQPNWIVANQVAEYNIQITYDPTLYENNFICRELISNRTVYTFSGTFPDIPELRYLTVCIGYGLDENSDPYRYSKINVLNFTLEKIPLPLETPVISCNENVVSITCATAGASIYYKVGSSQSFTRYTASFAIAADTTVQAYSMLNAQTSATVTRLCEYDDGIDEPTITCDGEYVEINCSTPSADIFYRVGTSGNFSLYTAPFPINSNVTVQAFSEVDGVQSEIVTENCIYVPVVLEDPVISCQDNIVSITCSTNRSEIYYSLDNSNFTQYTEPLTITEDTTVYAYSTYGNQTSTTVSETCIYTPAHDYSQDYLTFKVLSNGTIVWKTFGSGAVKTIEYKLNTGNWTEITSTSAGVTINVSEGDEVLFRGTNTTYCAGNKSNYSGFDGSTASINIEGNIMSLIAGDNFTNATSLSATYTFCQIFKNTLPVSAENLILPATTMSQYCYRAMFSMCNTLTKAPALPATTLTKGCYWYMFECCGITEAPELNATTLVQECYGHMFVGCTNLNYIKCMATAGFGTTNCLATWVGQKNAETTIGVASTGMFVKDGNTTWTTGVGGIPTGWYVSNGTPLYPPNISFDGETIELYCQTDNTSIYYRLGQQGSYSLYSTPIMILESTVIETYSTDGNQTSAIITQSLTYVQETPFEASNKTLSTWTYGGNTVTTPYSVNRIDGHSSSYNKGTFSFETSVNLKTAQPTYLWFQHADHKTEIYVDNVKADTHWGGYTAFFSDITNYVHRGTNNIRVAICNNNGSSLAPAAGDFNFNATLGNVKLFTSPCIPDMSYGYDGMHITASVSGTSATVTVKTKVPSGADVYLYIKDNGTTIYSDNNTSDGTEMTFTTTLSNITLWHGTVNPKLYDFVLEIYKNGDLYHSYTRPYGFRTYEYVINQSGILQEGNYTGFLLNGSPYYLRGVCMHDDLEGKANALTDADYTQEFAIIQELGCNFIRLAHYPHPKEVYDLCDQHGIIVQTEAPCVNKLQSTMPQEYYDHLTIQYTDMVQQHYNHPCIMFWGLSNETSTDNKVFGKTKIEEYTALIKSMDSERMVGYVMSHSYNNPANYYNDPNVDWFGSNIYVGWYIDKTSNDPTSQLNTRVDNTITRLSKPLAFSEYGCGGTQHCHSEDFMNTTTTGNYARHDIEYMMWLHEGHIAAIRNFPQLLFTAQWQLFDIAVSNRNEGYTVCLDGETASTDDNLRRLNNKGLVERDHVTKKDTFYIYKAEWNPTPFVHICGKDYTKTTDRKLKCYTNDGNTLSMYIGTSQSPMKIATVTDHIAEFSETDFDTGVVVKVAGDSTYDTVTF